MEEVKLHSSTLSKSIFNNHDTIKNLLQHSSDNITVISNDGTILYQSPSIKRIFGREPSEVIGKNVFEFIHPDDIPTLKQKFNKMVTKPGITQTIDFRVSHKNETWIPIEVIGNNQLHNKKINGIIITSREITKRKEIEKALKENEERYRSFLQNFKGIAYRGNINWTPIFFHGAVKEITGYSESDFKKENLKWLDIIHPADKKQILQDKATQKLTTTPQFSIEREYRIIRKDKQIRWIHEIIQNICDKHNNNTYFQGAIYDITERKEAEDLLRKTQTELERRVEERTLELAKVNKELQNEIKERKKAENDAIQTKDYLQNIINSASEIIISIDTNNKITTWNKTTELLSGYKQREVLSRNINHLTIFENPKDFINNIKNQNIPTVQNLIINTKQETKKILQLSASEIQGKNLQSLGILLIGKDVTYEIEAHGKLLSGNSYLITNKDNISPMDLFINLTLSKYKGLYITRTPPDTLFNITPPPDISIKILQQQKSPKTISTLQELITTIQLFTQKQKNTVTYLDRVDYLITNYTFKKFLSTLYQINDIITKNKSILLLYVDPSIIDQKELSLLQNELNDLPKQKIENIEIKDELYDILHFIYDNNQKNTLVFFKKISKEFSTVSKTTAKRIKDLETKGLIYIKKQGRLKTIHITEKGKALLHKRQII